MLGPPLARKDIRPGAAIGEGAKLRINRDKRIDARFDLGPQFLVGDLANDAMRNIAPSEGRIAGGACADEPRRQTTA